MFPIKWFTSFCTSQFGVRFLPSTIGILPFEARVYLYIHSPSNWRPLIFSRSILSHWNLTNLVRICPITRSLALGLKLAQGNAATTSVGTVLGGRVRRLGKMVKWWLNASYNIIYKSCFDSQVGPKWDHWIIIGVNISQIPKCNRGHGEQVNQLEFFDHDRGLEHQANIYKGCEGPGGTWRDIPICLGESATQ